FVVKYGGNVGIGLTNPAAKLEVDGGVIVQDRLYIWGDGNGWGNSIINGRVWSASSNIHLSPPGGSSVIIDGNYREAGGGTGTVNLCLNGDCRSAWPGGGSSVLATFNGGRTDLCDYCSGTSISGSLTAPANGILTLDYALLMDSPYCGVVISTYVDGVRIREENVRGCFGPLKAGNSDCSDSGAPSQAFTYKAAVSAGSHSFWVNGWTGGGACGNTRGFQVSPAYFQWQP
ncbi:MAG: hypothetical protein Q7S44_00975, partial [bacterium]|nr:hypothetical protein [bacterium]